MAGIEFLHPTDASADEGPAAGPAALGAADEPSAGSAGPIAGPLGPAHDAPGRRRAPRPSTLQFASALLWVAAAVLCVVAAYQRLYSVSYGPGQTDFHYALDAWGRLSGVQTPFPRQQGARYAVLLCTGAVACAVLAAGTVARIRGAHDRLGTPRIGLLLAGLGFAVTGALGGFAATLITQVDSTLYNARASVHFAAGLGDPVNGGIETSTGACSTLTLVASGAALLATCACAAAVTTAASRPPR